MRKIFIIVLINVGLSKKVYINRGGSLNCRYSCQLTHNKYLYFIYETKYFQIVKYILIKLVYNLFNKIGVGIIYLMKPTEYDVIYYDVLLLISYFT